MKDLLFLSNGHGEDMIACRILDEVRNLAPGLDIDAWPMVGRGDAYVSRRVPISGTRNLLPSAGFATLEWKLMGADLRAGWIRTHWNQFKDSRNLPGHYRMLVAVGDIIPLLASVFARTPFVFVGCAKSYYYDAKHGYTGLEKRLLRRHAMAVYPRDALTARTLADAGIPVRDLGNPMMDGLEGSGDRLGVAEGSTVVGMFPGTREDAEVNFLDLLAAAVAMARRGPDPARLRFLFPVRAAFDVAAMAAAITGDPLLGETTPEISGATDGVVLRVRLPGGAEAIVAKNRFADSLRLSDIVVGMAGTANEQAIGLGIPLVTAPSRGVQGERFVRMKMQFFGDSAVAVARDPDAMAAETLAILADPERARRMGAAGRERMGAPGASRAIAGEIVAALQTLRQESAA
jgi:uncharacterized protein (TIGR03492 family)